MTRPRDRVGFLLPVLAAAAVGLAAGLSPRTTVVLTTAVVSVLVLAVRLEWAALAVIGSSVFEGYLDLLSPWALEWLVLLLAIAWVVRRVQGPLHEHRMLTTTVPAAVFAGVLVVSTALHPNGDVGAAVVARYAVLLVALLVLADTLSGPLPPRRAALVCVGSCLLASVCGILTAIAREPHRVTGPLPLADDLAFALLAAVPLLGAVRIRNSRSGWWLWVAFATMLLAIVGTRSRAAVVALAVMLVLSVTSRMLSLRHAGALMLLVAAGIAFALAAVPHPVGQVISDPRRYAEADISARNDARLAAFALTREDPVLGLGPGSFALFQQDYRDDHADPVDRDVAYSTALEVSSELGVVGGLALLAVFVVPGVAARRRWRRDRSGLTAAAWLALVGLLTAALLESEQYRLPLWFMAAMAAALAHPARQRVPLFSDNSSGQVAART